MNVLVFEDDVMLQAASLLHVGTLCSSGPISDTVTMRALRPCKDILPSPLHCEEHVAMICAMFRACARHVGLHV